MDAGNTLKLALLIALGSLSAFYLFWRRRSRRAQTGDDLMPDKSLPSLTQLGIGFVTIFFDTLGIGSFATLLTLPRPCSARQAPTGVKLNFNSME